MRSYGLQTRASIGAVTGPVGLLLGLIAVVIALSSTADGAAHHPRHHVRHKITARQLAPGAVTAKAIAKGAVGRNALADGAVTPPAISPGAVGGGALADGAVTASKIGANAVTRGAIAPGSVYGAALVPETIHVTPIADQDAVAENGTWTPSNTEAALCGAGEALLGTGFVFAQPGNHEVSFLRVQPFISATGNGVAGEISSNSGGSAQGQIIAVCLGS